MYQEVDPPRRDRLTYLALAAFIAVIWLVTLSQRPLFNPDEGRYAEIPREMAGSGEFIIPHLNGVPYIEKPPLQYWATALCLKVFGDVPFAARLYTALTALLTVFVVWLTARRLFSAAAAWRAAAMLPSMMLFVVMGELLTLDMSLTCYMTVALGAFLAAQADNERSREHRLMLIAWAATALGVLTKGLVAAFIPAAVLILYSLYSRDWRPWRRLHAASGVPLFLLIAAPWYWLAARRLPDFLQFFFVHEHFARYLTPSAGREQPWWYFAAVLALGTVPWTFPSLRALTAAWRRSPAARGFDARVFLWLWTVFVCVFFSLSDSKLIPYVLPALPAFALLLAVPAPETLGRDAWRTALLTLAAGAALGVLCLLGPKHISPSDRSVYFLALAKPLAEIAALLGATGLYVISRRRRDDTRSWVFLGAGWCLAGLLFVRAASSVAPVYSGFDLARALPNIAVDAPVYSVGTYDQTLPFYWRRTLQLVAYRGELDYGLRHQPGAEMSVVEFVARWTLASEGYAVMEQDMFDDLKSQGVPMREMGRDLHRILVSRR